MPLSFAPGFRKAFCVPICLAAGAAAAHEFWLEPARFVVAPGAAVHLRRLVGESFRGQAWAGQSRRVVQLLHLAPGSAPTNLLPAATAADTLSTTVVLRRPGTHLLALASNEALLALPADQFTAYLQAEGLTQALALRQQRGHAAQPGREAYRRCAKTLVQAGPALPSDTARAWGRVAGLPLELVPEQNPYQLGPGAALTVRVLAAGRPVAGQLVRLWRRGARPQALLSTVHSNQNGRALLRLSEPGEYMVSTLRMQPVARPDADWQSTWSTLTFSFQPVSQP
ncbi:DUF4198 domain-containing protein [Hymenobacter weizhouensis]|uniref:DUF4198 domain-containing protein n=1 Tax=Hymenobacter sp. YIM 151500-1 TaxID=2987689 RepID=UPI002226A10E|nr:DUF4198 domain-containing protein [Hymenobacter sp. YIM 151500-1]UYZ63507.1 DUF4198 domain-containing protein [Hymenobacter sp. YIM 151500-1]